MPCTVLLVDDSATMRAVLKTYLAKRNCTLLEASSCEEALKLATGRTVHIVIADVWLAGKSGLELIETLRRPPYVRPTGVLVVSSDRSPALDEKVRALNVDAFLHKPFAPPQLVALLQGLLDKVGAGS